MRHSLFDVRSEEEEKSSVKMTCCLNKTSPRLHFTEVSVACLLTYLETSTCTHLAFYNTASELFYTSHDTHTISRYVGLYQSSRRDTEEKERG